MTDVETKMNDGNFAVYIHWPFCAQKCPYCDFNSHVRHKGWDEDAFLGAYKQEIDWVADRTGPRTVSSIFFGGGTPSLMQPQTTGAIIDHIAERWTLAPDAEITLEANPNSVEANRFRGYRAAGVNRISIGLQSLRDDELKKLGRLHSVAEAKAALAIARENFDRLSFDLIYARPGQDAAAWRDELAEALSLGSEHLSLYQLTIEPETPYAQLHAAGKLLLPEDEVARDLYELTSDMAASAGLDAYEVSNYASPGRESRHNLTYWRYGEYAGIGPGAHGRIIQSGARHATVTERNPETWVARVATNGNGFTEMTALSPIAQAEEALLMGLRLKDGIALDHLARLGNVTVDAGAIEDLCALGLLQASGRQSGAQEDWRTNELAEIRMCAGPGLTPSHAAPRERLRVTPSGRMVLNAVVAKLANAFEPVRQIDKVADAL